MKTITDIDEYLELDYAGLAGTRLICPFCGMNHEVPFDIIRVGENLVEKIPEILQLVLGSKPQHPVAIFDRAIELFIDENILSPLHHLGFRIEKMGLGAPGQLLESSDLLGNETTKKISNQADVLVGMGSGVICDLTKWIGTHLHLPFILVGTAPSMNGYTSITATITENEIKKSEMLSPARAILGDVHLMTGAPLPMIQAGMQDLAARAICNADWKLSNLIRETYFCPVPYRLTAHTQQNYLSVANGIGKSQPDAIRQLVEAIMVSGISMTMLGHNTSPSSGGEHILSHFWDLLVHLRGRPKNLHGAQVGIGTIIMLALYEHIRNLDIRKVDPQRILHNRPSLEEISRENRGRYGVFAPAFDEVTREKRIKDIDFVNYLENKLGRWDEIWEKLDPYIVSLDVIKKPLEEAGINLKLDAIQRTPQEGLEALLNGSRYRPRYTLLDMAWELGIFPNDAEMILENAQVL